MTTGQFIKDPDATLDYQVDWTAWLGSDAINTVTWIIPPDLTKTNESQTATTATVWLSGGTLSTRSGVVCRITTAAGRADDRTLRLSIQDK